MSELGESLVKGFVGKILEDNKIDKHSHHVTSRDFLWFSNIS